MVSLGVVGGPSVGKTTAIAKLAQLLDAFPEDELKDCHDLAKELGRPSAQHAWMMDSLSLEREQGGTAQPHMQAFESPSGNKFTAIDTPGRESLTTTMVSITSLVDIAVLVISAAAGEYEAGIDSGLTKELAVCCFTMGIKHMIVLVTKMDDPQSGGSPRFEDIQKTVGSFLKTAGYKNEPPFVPVSGFTGENLKTKGGDIDWYGGPTALDSLDSIAANVNRPADKPLRLPVLKVHQVAGETIIVGRVETGSIRTGIKIIFAPSGRIAEVQSLQKNGESVSEAKPGEIVGVRLDGDFETDDLWRGMVASQSTTDPATDCETFVTQLKILDHPGVIREGYCPTIAIHTASVPCEFEELISKIDPKTGKDAENNPAQVKAGDIIKVRLRPQQRICVESFETYPSLGRFTLRDHGKIVAVGVVKEVSKRDIPKITAGNENTYFDG